MLYHYTCYRWTNRQKKSLQGPLLGTGMAEMEEKICLQLIHNNLDEELRTLSWLSSIVWEKILQIFEDWSHLGQPQNIYNVLACICGFQKVNKNMRLTSCSFNYLSMTINWKSTVNGNLLIPSTIMYWATCIQICTVFLNRINIKNKDIRIINL